MAGKKEKLVKQKREAEAYEYPNSKAFPIGSAMRIILEQMDKHKGIIRIDNKATYDGKGIDISRIVSCLHILANPLHPENNWACLVEMVKYDGEAYLRLVPSIPVGVKKRWAATGKPPRQMAINDVQEMISVILGGTTGARSRKAVARSDNPYPPHTMLARAFALASDWSTPSELLDRICRLPKVNRKYASSILHNLGNVTRKQNNGRSHLEERPVNGVKMVRAVPGPE